MLNKSDHGSGNGIMLFRQLLALPHGIAGMICIFAIWQWSMIDDDSTNGLHVKIVLGGLMVVAMLCSTLVACFGNGGGATKRHDVTLHTESKNNVHSKGLLPIVLSVLMIVISCLAAQVIAHIENPAARAIELHIEKKYFPVADYLPSE